MAPLPPVLDSLGLFVYSTPEGAAGGLALQLAAALCVAGLCRARTLDLRGARGAGGTLGRGRRRRCRRQHCPGGPAQPVLPLVAALLRTTAPPPPRLPPAGARLAPRDFTTPSPSAPPPHAPQLPDQAAAARWWRTASLLAMTLLHAAGRVLLPAAWFVLGASRPDVLHGAYLAWMLAYFMAACARLAPPPQQRTSPPPAHTLIRAAGSAHLLAIYAALAARLPGLACGIDEALLRLLGLWDPSVAGDLLPVLAVLLAATLHAAAGKWLAANSSAAEPDGGPGSPRAAAAAAAAAPAAQLAQRLAAWVGKAAIAVGVPALLALGYALALADAPVGLLGAGYLGLLALLLLLPPSKAGWLELQRYRAGTARRGLARRCGVLRRSLRWAPLAALALYCCADLGAQYLLAAGQQEGRALLPPGAAAFLVDVVGLDGGAAGGAPLAARLARPALLLLAMYAYRGAFAAGVMARQARGVEQQTRPPGWAEAKQARWSWLLRRLAVLHASKLVAFAVFYCAMHLPSAAGLGLVAVLALTCLALRSGPLGAEGGEPLALALAQGALEVATTVWLVAAYAFQVGLGLTGAPLVCLLLLPAAAPARLPCRQALARLRPTLSPPCPPFLRCRGCGSWCCRTTPATPPAWCSGQASGCWPRGAFRWRRCCAARRWCWPHWRSSTVRLCGGASCRRRSAQLRSRARPAHCSGRPWGSRRPGSRSSWAPRWRRRRAGWCCR